MLTHIWRRRQRVHAWVLLLLLLLLLLQGRIDEVVMVCRRDLRKRYARVGWKELVGLEILPQILRDIRRVSRDQEEFGWSAGV